MDDISEYFPIKLTPGFIAVAFHIGCIGCNFCSVRYGHSRNKLFTAGLQRNYPTCPSSIFTLLRKMPSFRKARIPIRLGNDTDLRFELNDSIELLNLLPSDYPVTALTRFPISLPEARQLSRPNLILKLTATPASVYLTSPDNSFAVIESANFFDTPVVIALGPVTADNFDATLRLLHTVPKKPNIAIYVKPLNREFHVSLARISVITQIQYNELRQAIMELGFRHMSQLMCSVNHNLRLRHKRVSDVPEDEQPACHQCSAYDLCYSPDEISLSALDAELASLGLCALSRPARISFKSYTLEVDAPTAFGDEAYLSEVLGCKMKLTGTHVGTAYASYAASRQVMERWERVSFFPYQELCRDFQPFIEKSFCDAESKIARND